MVEYKKTVKLSVGDVVLEAPIARRRNKVLMDSRVNGKIDEMLMMVNMLPICVVEHPFGDKDIKYAIENLRSNEYDELIDALAEILKPNKELQKKSSPESDQEEH